MDACIPSSQSHIFKRLSSLDFLCSYCLFTLHFNSPKQETFFRGSTQPHSLPSSPFAEDTSQIQLCHMDAGCGLKEFNTDAIAPTETTAY